MGLEDDILVFEQVPVLAMLGRPALRILAIGAESHRVQSGAVLFYAGDIADAGYIVHEGSFLLEPDPPVEGGEITAGPGSLLGELALLTDTVRPATATALEPSTVIRVSRSLFLRMLESYPAAARKLRDIMAQRIDQWSGELESVRRVIDRGERQR